MPSSQHEGSRAPKLRGPRLPIARVVVLVIVCASGATYIFRNSLLESGSSTLTADSGIGAGHKPPPLSEPPNHLAAPLRLPAQEPASGSETSAPAASSGQHDSHVPGADELVDFANMLRQQKQAAVTGAADASLNATPARIGEPAPPVQPPTEPQAKPFAEIPANVETPPVQPPAEPQAKPVAEIPATIETPPVHPPAEPQAKPVAEIPATVETPPVRPPAEPQTKPVAEVPAKVEAPLVQPPAEPQTKPEAEIPAAVETPPVQPPAESQAKPVAEIPATVEMPPVQPPVEPQAKPVAENPAQPAPAKVEAKPVEDALMPETGPATTSERGKTDASQDQVAAIIPPRAPQTMLAISGATVGVAYSVDLLPFSDRSGGAKGIALRVEPNLPEGLSFVDLGSGLGEISGRPAKAGQFAFDIVATNNVGGAARMTTTITVAPPPATPELPTPRTDANQKLAALGPTEKAARFLRGFDGGACFHARGRSAVGNSIAIEGVGSEKGAFQRFYASFIHDVGVEPTLTVRLITPPQCPAVALIEAAQSNRAAAPTIELATYDVPRGKPVAGLIGSLAGRHFDLLLITNDGLAYKIEGRGLASDQRATFSVAITPDASSIGALQILVAVASPKPLDALATFRSGPAAEILPKVAAQLGPSDAALEVEYFKFLK
jgi:hypothetical protein